MFNLNPRARAHRDLIRTERRLRHPAATFQMERIARDADLGGYAPTVAAEYLRATTRRDRHALIKQHGTLLTGLARLSFLHETERQ